MSQSDKENKELHDVVVRIEDNQQKNRTGFFAFTALIVLTLALSSLTIVSSRQAALASAEAEMKVLQERITASMFLGFEAKISGVDQPFTSNEGRTLTLLREKFSLGNAATENIGLREPEEAGITYYKITKNISHIKSEISGGADMTGLAQMISYSDKYLAIALYTISLDKFSTNALLGILLITCGILGSIMSTMRDGKGSVFKTIILGASVGFVALLGVKGGSTIFIITNAGFDIPFNPYSTAFIGVVSGMFSEKLYLALAKFTAKALGEKENK